MLSNREIPKTIVHHPRRSVTAQDQDNNGSEKKRITHRLTSIELFISPYAHHFQQRSSFEFAAVMVNIDKSSLKKVNWWREYAL